MFFNKFLRISGLVLSSLLWVGLASVSEQVPLRAQSTPLDLYVAPGGADNAPGTSAAPLASILRAGQLAGPGTTVHVLPGTYEGGFQTIASGTEAARITYLATKRGAVKLVPPAGSSVGSGWDNRGSYVTIDGFEVDGTGGPGRQPWSEGIYVTGSYDIVQRNDVHNIANNITCTSHGAAGIGADSYYGGVHIDILANYVHDNNPPGGCGFDQGIYCSTSCHIVNNVVARIEGGSCISLWHDATDDFIINNTLIACPIFVGAGEGYHGVTTNRGSFVVNNIITDTPWGISQENTEGAKYTHNLFFRVPTPFENGAVDDHPFYGDPHFVSATDFHLTPSSPAIGVGMDGPADDFEGNLRPPAPSVGAFEFISAKEPPTASVRFPCQAGDTKGTCTITFTSP